MLVARMKSHECFCHRVVCDSAEDGKELSRAENKETGEQTTFTPRHRVWELEIVSWNLPRRVDDRPWLRERRRHRKTLGALESGPSPRVHCSSR